MVSKRETLLVTTQLHSEVSPTLLPMSLILPASPRLLAMHAWPPHSIILSTCQQKAAFQINHSKFGIFLKKLKNLRIKSINYTTFGNQSIYPN